MWRRKKIEIAEEPIEIPRIRSYNERNADTIKDFQNNVLIFGQMFEPGEEGQGDQTAPIALDKFSAPRAMSFSQYIGQTKHVGWLKLAIKASQQTGKPLPHMAIIGEAGMGKTSLAACMADAMGVTALATVGSALKNMNEVAAFVEQVNGGIAFIDEAHDLSKLDTPVVSTLLPLLEDWTLYANGTAKQVQPFTCVMATTDVGMLDAALLSRMGIPYTLNPYTETEMERIVNEHASTMDMDINAGSAYQIAKRSRGNPRFCINLLRKCVTVAIASSKTLMDVKDCGIAFDAMELDQFGMLPDDRKLLTLLKGGPHSATRCADYLGMSKLTFERTVEKFLFRMGCISTSNKGKSITTKGAQYV